MTTEELARKIVGRLREEGCEAYFVGGCVRDRLLGRPSKDFDVATAAQPGEILALFPGSRAVGAAFGVVLVKEDRAEVEVATFRRDHDYLDGRRPEGVTFTRSAREDVARRDFTINGLLYDPDSEEVIDYVGGQEDLASGLIRAIGDPARRFAEDKLRLLRAVRFAARLAFRIEPETFEAIRQAAPEIRQIAAERIRDELSRILTEGGARRGFESLDETGLMEVLLPEVKRLQGVEQPPEFHPEGDVWRHTLLMLEMLPPKPPVTLALGVLLHDIGKPDTFERAADRIRFHGHVERGVELADRILRRLRYSNDEIEQVEDLVANHMRFMHVAEMREGKLKRFLRKPRFAEHLALHRLDCLSSHQDLTSYDFVERKLAAYSAEQLRPAPLVNGSDLIAAGYEPGPRFAEMLGAVEEAQLEGILRSREEALEWVEKRFGAPAERSPSPDAKR